MNKLKRINEEITLAKGTKVRLVGEGINEIMNIEEARKVSRNLGLDLIEMNNSETPVLKVGNYEKILYEYKKSLKKKSSHTQLKEIQLSVNISSHDLETKVNKARELLEKGHKVKVVLTMKGRELSRREESKKSLLTFLVMIDIENFASIENTLVDNGNKTFVVLKKRK